MRVINQMVKKRDFWMPFAPSCSRSAQHDYLVNPKSLPSPYMMMTFDTENYREHGIAAPCTTADLQPVAAADGRRRVEPRQPAQIYAILQGFEPDRPRRCSIPPSTCTAYPIVGGPPTRRSTCFDSSGLRYLQLGDWLVSKPAYGSRPLKRGPSTASPITSGEPFDRQRVRSLEPGGSQTAEQCTIAGEAFERLGDRSRIPGRDEEAVDAVLDR